VTIRIDGQEVWASSPMKVGPSTGRLPEGQSADQFSRERQMASFASLANVQLPATLVRKTGYDVAGHSALTAEGIGPYTPKQ